jgi:putative SOS response-associated peptidase YedK
MCFHYALGVEVKDLVKRYLANLENHIDFLPISHANAFNYGKMPIVKENNVIELLNWGLIPNWIKGIENAKKIRTQTLNSKSETVFEKPSFKYSIINKRCLIPTTGFFEWQHEGTKKTPHFIKLKKSEIFSFAGIWSAWVDKEETGEIIETFSILTMEANEMMAKIHNTKKRMPVIIDISSELDWLNPKLNKTQIAELMQPFPQEEMVAEVCEII